MKNRFEFTTQKFDHKKVIPPIEEGGTSLAIKQPHDSTKNYTTFQTPFHAKHEAMPFAQNVTMLENLELHKKAKELENKEREKVQLEEFLQSGKTEEIVDFLLEDGFRFKKVFCEEIERVKSENPKLSTENFLSEKDWKILTALEIFDKGTFEHSVRTCLIAKETFETETRLPELGKEIEREGIILKQFYIACLFHDLGKFKIPKFILNSQTSDEVWTSLFMEMLAELPLEKQDDILIEHKLPIPDKDRGDHSKVHAFFEQRGFRAVTVVPINKAFSTQQQLAALHERKFDENLPLIKIMEPHEKDSKQMLKKLGYGLEAILAGNHHGHDRNEEEQDIEDPISTAAMQVIIELASDIIHTFDVYDALINGRSYLKKQSHLHTLASIVHHTQDGKIKTKWVVASLLNDDLKQIKKEDFSQNSEELEIVKNFIEQNLRNNEISYFQQG